ncbi:MAG: hypothetical protein K8S23_12715 [Candidatus Cloacimonetes bacterium]|nr:hypothetical protein [Candidatus Cloacimonadota bacterium]
MDESIKVENKQQVNFKLIEVEKIKFFENDPAEIGFNNTKVDTKIHTELKINMKQGIIGIILEIAFSLKEKPEINLFGIKTEHTYKIQEISKIVKKITNNGFNIPDQFLAILISVAYSGTRGMLSVLVTNKKYKKIILPIVDPKKLLPQKSN